MTILKNISLKNYNTFGIDIKAKEFVKVTEISKLQEVLSKEKNIFLLSGGSNILLTKNIDKLVVFIDIKGIDVIAEDKNSVELKVNAGENWHEFVLYCINKNFGGLENLSLIPGNVGTCPIQNIGAYGVEVKETITQVDAIEISSGKLKSFTNSECKFGYRNSVFKNELKGQFVLTSVQFKLTKTNHKLETGYGAIETELAKRNIQNPTIKDISDAVISIRQSKLPNPKEIGNSGSFFKNPVIASSLFLALKKEYPNIPSYQVSENQIKVPAGWLIETAGFKGKRFGDAGVHEKQALVLVNYGNASGKEIHGLALKIQKSILEKFHISLEIEVNVI